MRLQYEIATTGQEQLRSVLRGVEREVAASDKRVTQTRRAGAREQTGLMHGPGRKEQMAAIRQSERAQSMATARQMRERVAASRAEQRASLATAKADERARIQADRNVARARESLDRQRSKALFQQHQEAERAATRLGEGRRGFAGRIGTGIARSVGGAVGTIARVGGAAVGIAGGFAAGEALRERSSVQRGASVLANTAGDPGLKDKLADEAGGLRGFTGTEAISGMQAFVSKTGNLDAARASLKGIAELALATDSDFEDLGETAGNAFNVIAQSIDDPKKRIEALQKVMSGWAGQGDIGAVELKDLAQFGGRLGAASNKFAGDPADLLLKMGAMSQAAVRSGGASDAAEATTGVARFASDLVKHPAQKALTAMGVDIYAGPGKKGSKEYKSKLKDPATIIADILEKTKGSLPQNEDVVNAESGKVLQGFAGIYLSAEQKKKGSGRGAVLGEFKKYEDAAISPEARKRRAESRLADPDIQMKEATKAFNDAIGKELMPVTIKFVRKLAEMAPQMGEAAKAVARFANYMLDNPLKGVGAIVAVSVAKDIATAGIGKAVEATLRSVLLTAMGAGNSGGGGGGGGITPVQNVTLAVAGTVAIAAAAVAIDQVNKLDKEAGGGVTKNLKTLLPGFDQEGNFDTDNVIGDVLHPFDAMKRRGRGLLNLTHELNPSNVSDKLDQEAKSKRKKDDIAAASQAIAADEEMRASMKATADGLKGLSTALGEAKKGLAELVPSKPPSRTGPIVGR